MKFITRTFLAAPLILASVAWANSQAPVDTTKLKAPIVLACVGDSITAGGASHGYPAQLGRMLGDSWKVENFGVSGTTLMDVGKNSYRKREKFQSALDSKPNVVVIMLGTNDSKPHTWPKKERFVPDYKSLIARFKALETQPRIFIAKPPYVNDGGKTTGINEANIVEQLPLIDEVAKEENVGVIDVHAATLNRNELYRDGVHPVPKGSAVIAKTVYRVLIGKEFEGEVPPAPKPEKTRDKGEN